MQSSISHSVTECIVAWAAGVAALAVAAASPVVARSIDFNEVARFDVSSTGDPGTPGNANPGYIGDMPFAIAWNGATLFVAGFDPAGYKEVHAPANNRGPISIVEIQDATTTGIVATPDFGAPFGTIETAVNGRGYVALDLQGDKLAAANDQGGNSPNAIQLFDTSDGLLVWNLSASGQSRRGSGGVAFDPGFPGGEPAAGSGVAFAIFGQQRRALLSESDGTSRADFSSGLVWKPESVPANFARDMAFDPEQGDIYVRHNNDVHKAERTADNAASNQQILVDNGGNGEFVAGQHISFLPTAAFGDLLIYNDDVTADPGMPQDPFVDVVKLVDTQGVQQQTRFNFIGGGTEFDVPNGSGVFDFDFDPVSQTVAILDALNYSISIFELADTPTVAGDYNGDATVGAADYIVWRDTLGGTGSTLAADGNGNQEVDSGDYGLWKSNFGAEAARPQLQASGNAVAPVPEPAAIALFLAGIVISTTRCVGRQRRPAHG